MIVGVDFATNRQERTWMARGERKGDNLIVNCLDRVENKNVLAKAKGAQVIGIDVPLGWPVDFQHAVAHYRADKPTAINPALFPERYTDKKVKEKLQLNFKPLSVAADRIARCTWEAATLLSRASLEYRVNPVEHTLEPCVIEVYPKATLWTILGKDQFNKLKGYKGKDGGETRKQILNLILRRGFQIQDQKDYRKKILDHDDALDAVLALASADAFQCGRVVFPDPAHRPRTAQEGWIYYPECSLP
jgi:predicted nuclease with RNAse H fold